ncbi:proprotein convertase P-domain-containing protein [Actinomycetes bacterium KLBMP 9797]
MRTSVRAALLAAVLLITSPAAPGGRAEAAPAPAAPKPPSPPSGTAAGPASASAAGSAEAAASGRARRTGRPVEVDALGTVDTKVVANPSGTFTVTMYNRPVRAKTARGWAPIDTTLVARPDGTVTPQVSAVPVRFSGGASVPLVRARGDGGDFGLDWAGRLPKPRLAGSTATYPDLLPGVDLKLTATATGFTEQIVVRDATAARDPRLRALRFGLHTTGRATAPTTQGLAEPAGPKGRRPFAGATPVGWKVTGKTLTVQPDAAALADPDTAYPLTMDGPSFGEKLHWMLLRHDPTTGAKAAFWDSSEYIARIGRVRGENTRWRSYFELNTAAIAGKHVLRAELQVYEWWAESCTPQPVELWHIGAISPTTTWGDATPFHRKAAEVATAKGYDETCQAGRVGFDVKDLMVEAANGSWPTTTVALKAREDDASYGAKEFLYRPVPELGLTDTVLAIAADYNSIPDRATDLKVNGAACTTAGLTINDATPALGASISDADPENIRGVFRWWEDTGGPPTAVASAATQLGGPGAVSVPVPDDRPLRDGARYAFGVTVEDETGDASDGQPWCRFTVDTTSPAAAPAVSSAEFPPAPATGPPLYTAGRFTFDAGGDPDVVAFKYGIGRPPVANTVVAADAPGGRATVAYTADTLSTSFSNPSVAVYAVDRAGNLGPRRDYAFKVSPVVNASTVYGYWKADSVAGGKLADDKAKYDATISGTMTSTRDRLNNATGAVRLDGTASHAATGVPLAPKTEQNTFGSFTVMGWVRLDRGGDHATALSQDGDTDSGFALKYTALPRAWQFSMENTAYAEAVAVPQVGVWTHLAGVYDHQAGKLVLYVNGRRGGEADHTSTSYAAGPTVLGRAKYGGRFDDFWPGDLDELQIYPWAASDYEVRHRMSGPAWGPNATWTFAEGSGQSSADNTTNGHTLGLTGGSSWATPGRDGTGSALRLDGQSGYAHTGGPVAARSPDGTFDSFTVMAWVKLNKLDSWASAVSQDGRRDSGFSLGYSSYPRGWNFGMHPADADGGGGEGYLVADPTPQTGVWTHLAGVYDHAAGTISLYVNGRLAKSMARPSTWYATGGLLVGRGKNDGWWVDHWPGEIDDVHVLAGARSAKQITDAMAGPEFAAGAAWSLNDGTADATGHGHTLSLWTGASWTTGKEGSGLRLAGPEGHAYTAGPVVRPDAGFTVLGWAKLDTVDRHQTVVSQDGQLHSGLRLYYDNDAKAWSFAIAGNTRDGGTVPDGVVRGTTPPRAGEWTHLAGVYDHGAKQMRMFVNGRLQGSAAYTSVAKADQVLAIGRARSHGWWVDYLTGVVDEVELRPEVTLPEEVHRLSKIQAPQSEQNQPTRIEDLSTAESSIPTPLTGVTAEMTSTLQVHVKITHSYRGDLVLRLIAPDNTDYLLEDLSGTGDVDNFEKTYWLNASGRIVNGVWKLRVADRVLGDTGTIDRWKISAPVSNEPGPAVPWAKVAGYGFTVANRSTTERTVTVSGIPGNAPRNLHLAIDKTTSTSARDLKVTLIAPDRREYVVHDGAAPPTSPPPSDPCSVSDTYDLKKSFFVNAGTSPANGVWTLRILHTTTSGAPTITGWSLSSAINLQASAAAPNTKFANPTDVAIDEYWTTSSAYACGVPGTAANDVRVAVDIKHPNRGDLRLELQDPEGAASYLLEDVPDTDTGEDVRKTYTVPGVAQIANGAWTLRVIDTRTDWAGVVNEWSVQILPSAQAAPAAGWQVENTTDVPIVDDGWTESPITVSNLTGMAPKDWRVTVAITHTHRGDLALYLQAPDGTGYLLEDLTGTGDVDGFTKTYTVNGSAEIANGEWKLRVLDAVWGDTGHIDAWSLSTSTFPAVGTTAQVPVVDLATAESPLTVSGMDGNAPNGLQVRAKITHAKPEQLVVTLLAPDGTAYPLHDKKPVLPPTFAVDLAAEPLNGVWKLRVADTVGSEAGTIDSWGMALTPAVAWPEQRGFAFAVDSSVTGASASGNLHVGGLPGNAPADLRLTVHTSYYWVSELKIWLVAPDGSTYVVHDRATTMPSTFTVNASAEVANGWWKLTVQRASGTGTVSISGWSLWSPANQHATPAGPATKFANGTDVAIADGAYTPTESAARVDGITGTAANDLRVTVDIKHPNRGDLKLSLQAPDDAGTYLLEDFPDSDTGDDVFKTYTVPGVAQLANGHWYLAVLDNRTGNTGTIDGWSIQILPSPQAAPPAGWRVETGTGTAILDYATVESPITVTGLAGMAPKDWQVSVALRHTYRGDLRLDLVAPDGTGYLLEDLTGTGNVDDLTKTYTFNGSAELANGVWKLRIRDGVWGDAGHLDSWSLAAAPAGGPAPAVAWPAVTRGGFTVDGATYGVTGTAYAQVTGVPGNAPQDLRLTMSTSYSWVQGLKVWLTAPDGTAYVVHDGASTMPGTFTVDASAEVANGWWQLTVQRNSTSGTVAITGWSLWSPVNQTPSATGPALKFATGTDVSITDDGYSSADSGIWVSGVPGNAPAILRVAVDVKHPNRGDLILRLVAPDGTVYLLEDFPNTDTGDNVFATYEINGSAETANGSWRLRVSDTVAGNAGRIDGWSLNLGAP